MTPDALAFASASLLVISLAGLVVLRLIRGGGKKTGVAPSSSPRAAGAAGAAAVDVAASEDADVKLRVAVYYGTQTGTSERFAREVEEEFKRRYGNAVRVRTTDLEHVTADSAEDTFSQGHEPFAVILQSTYGDGEPTDTSTEFVHWLRDQAEDGRMPDLLENLTYSVFGLGNSSYEQFNAAAKLVDKSMHALGAVRLLKIHLGDDDCTLEDDFQAWREALWTAVEEKYGVSAEGGATSGGEAPSYDVTAATKRAATAAEAEVSDAMRKPPKGGVTTQFVPYAAAVAAARELHDASSDRSCVHVEFDISGTGITYQHGDHLGVFAENAMPVARRAAACLGLSLDDAFSLTSPENAPASLPPPFPTPCTLATALTKYADLLSPPRKAALAALASVATDPEEAARLNHLASSLGKEEYASFVVEPARSLVEVMEAFPSAVPPLGLFFGAVSPRLAPRYYSISSSPLDNPGVVTATVAVVRGETRTGRMHEGVASTYLARFVPVPGSSSGPGSGLSSSSATTSSEMKDVRVPLFIRSSTFKLPRNPAAPVVMIGPGTGYAPFRGFLQERAAAVKAGATLGPAHLFFGCRRADQDYIYREEMEAALVGGGDSDEKEKKNTKQQQHLSSLHVAFSRDPDAHAGKKTYVQDKLMAAGKEIYAVMKGTAGGGVGANEGCIYVCGDAKGMARDVHRALHSILMTEGGYAGHEAEEIVKRLSDTGRYHKDVW